MRLFILQCCTSVYHTYLFMVITMLTMLFILQCCHKNLPNLLHNPTLAMLGLLQISYIILNLFSDSRLWVRVKCLDIHILNLATHQTHHSNMSLPHMVFSRISQVMVLVHHICLAPQP